MIKIVHEKDCENCPYYPPIDYAFLDNPKDDRVTKTQIECFYAFHCKRIAKCVRDLWLKGFLLRGVING